MTGEKAISVHTDNMPQAIVYIKHITYLFFTVIFQQQ